MKNKQRVLVLAVLFITAIFIVNSYADPGTANTKTIVGFAGVPTTEFSKAKELGAATVQVNTLSASELQSALETAKSLGLGLVGRAEIVDIATFVITPKKLRQSPDYIANEATTAKIVLGPGDYDFSIVHDFNIDENSIYATGMSNGAQMCYRLACELADKIAAIAPCGSIGTFDNCTPSRSVPVMHFHGLEGPCCFYDGGQCGTCMAEFLNALGIPRRYLARGTAFPFPHMLISGENRTDAQIKQKLRYKQEMLPASHIKNARTMQK